MKTKMLIGSRALKHHFDDFPRAPKDTDYICKDEVVKGADCKICGSFNKVLEKYNCDIAPPIVLYTLKVSHIYFSNIWYNKTLYDIRWMQSKGVNEIDEEIYDLLYKDWEEFFGAKKAKLTVKNEEFFTKKVKRKYEHDFLHDCVKFYDEPMYAKIKKDKTKAMVSKKMFDNLSHSDKLKLCLEEIYAVALERYLIPKGFRMHFKASTMGSMRLLLTTMTKGWFPKFIAMNAHEIITQMDNTFIQKFKKRI